ncbi:MAG TPA: FGGY family carbohydrate kinase [Roseiflexaceae bacterium]|nr:FGGY family carbohydrate kinase [Roseiflexaceae bacterium]
MDDTLLLGIDVGTTNCKALLFDRAGVQRGAGSVPTPIRRPQPGLAEHDAEELWRAVVAAVRQALRAAGSGRVFGVGVASMAEAGVLLDRAGRPLHPIIAWFDSRTLPQQRWWLEQIGAPATYALTGLMPRAIHGAMKLLWLRDHAPAAYAAAVRWLNIADYIAFRLCGAQATDASLAGRTLLFDLAAHRWSAELVARAGLRLELLPDLARAGAALGGVTPEAAAETGLPAGATVALAGHDHICGAFAAGVSAPGDCLDSMGTAESLLLALDRPRLDPALAGVCSCAAHVARGRFCAQRGIPASGAAVEWAARLLAWPRTDLPPRAAMLAAAAEAPPGSYGALFLPGLAAGDRGAWLGLSDAAGPAALARAVFEGLACEWRRILERIEAATGLRASQVRVIGGGARAGLWVQIKADALGRPLHVLALSESVALGAALLGGLAAGLYANEAEALAAATPAAQIVEPDPQRAAFYDRLYREVFLPARAAVEPAHAAIEGLYN